MAVKTSSEIIEAVKGRIGNDVSDDALTLLEDVTDTLNDLQTKANGDGVDWKSEAERIDKEWREKYFTRFSGDVEDNNPPDNNKDEPKKTTYESLFEEKE